MLPSHLPHITGHGSCNYFTTLSCRYGQNKSGGDGGEEKRVLHNNNQGKLITSERMALNACVAMEGLGGVIGGFQGLGSRLVGKSAEENSLQWGTLN